MVGREQCALLPNLGLEYLLLLTFLAPLGRCESRVMTFIGKEEEQLTKAFGKEYEDYMARVDRLVPFKKP